MSVNAATQATRTKVEVSLRPHRPPSIGGKPLVAAKPCLLIRMMTAFPLLLLLTRAAQELLRRETVTPRC
jgi:hypothetical protein